MEIGGKLIYSRSSWHSALTVNCWFARCCTRFPSKCSPKAGKRSLAGQSLGRQGRRDGFEVPSRRGFESHSAPDMNSSCHPGVIFVDAVPYHSVSQTAWLQLKMGRTRFCFGPMCWKWGSGLLGGCLTFPPCLTSSACFSRVRTWNSESGMQQGSEIQFKVTSGLNFLKKPSLGKQFIDLTMYDIFYGITVYIIRVSQTLCCTRRL